MHFANVQFPVVSIVKLEQSAMTKLRFNDQCTAYHEAGHCVAAFLLNLSVGRKGVTIVANKEALGSAHILSQLRDNPEYEMSCRTHVRIQKLAVSLLSGDIAERRFSRRRTFGGGPDVQKAFELLGCISRSHEITDARWKVADLEAHLLVKSHWPEIKAVAAALIEHKNLTAKQVREVILGWAEHGDLNSGSGSAHPLRVKS
jgi:ATP-dependent Zn protease